MNKREASIYAIINAALGCFRENGYQSSSVRQIADRAGVSLGMVNHYFGSKECLGAQVLSLLDERSARGLSAQLNFFDDPILYDLVSVRIMFNCMFYGDYKEFYLDSLRYDFFFNYLSSRPTRLIEALKPIYHFEASADDIQLYSRYLPYMMEKTLILKKEEGLFPSIPYEEVPYLICQTAMNHFIPEKDILARNEESKRIASTFSQALSEDISEELILEFVQRFDLSLQQASANAHSFWLGQISSMLP